MDKNFKESGSFNFYYFFQKRESNSPDNYFYEGNRVGNGAKIELDDITMPLKLQVNFTPSSDINKYLHETGLLVIARSPMWRYDKDTQVKATNNRLFLPSSENFPLNFYVKPHKANKNIYVGFRPALFDPKTGQYNSMGTWSALNFDRVNSHEYSFKGSANNKKADFTDMQGTLKSLNYNLDGHLEIR
jgi:hypothetical protein